MNKLTNWLKNKQNRPTIPAGIALVIILYLVTTGFMYAFFGFDIYEYTSNLFHREPQPLSTRGLPPPETDVPVVLPSDPGEAGKLTLAGIDSNNDGIRDDLEREIVYMYPQNEEVRRILRAMVKKEQQLITTTGDHEYFKGLRESYFAYRDCYLYKAYGSIYRDQKKISILWEMSQNTSARKKADENNNYIALPYSAPIYGTQEACTQPLVQGKY